MSQESLESSYTTREEVAHSLTHGAGALLSVAGLVMLVLQTTGSGQASHLISALIFGGSLVVLYTASTLYHAFPWPRIKGIFKTLDHVAIYFLIAGTYTPFALITLGGSLGYSLLAVIWALALGGTAFELLSRGKMEKLALVFYLLMGWVAVFFIKPLAELLTTNGMILLVLGGVLYSVGAIFYAWKKLPYNHTVWHLFVLAGSITHFFCILETVLYRSSV